MTQQNNTHLFSRYYIENIIARLNKFYPHGLQNPSGLNMLLLASK